MRKQHYLKVRQAYQAMTTDVEGNIFPFFFLRRGGCRKCGQKVCREG